MYKPFITTYPLYPQHRMNHQKPSILATIIITLCVSFLSSHAEPAKTYNNGIPAWSSLKKIIIPAIDFEQLTLREALEALDLKIGQASDKKITPNFIINDLDGEFNNRRVTLQLSNIPANVLLKYIADQVRGAVHYNKHAIIISPLRAPRR